MAFEEEIVGFCPFCTHNKPRAAHLTVLFFYSFFFSSTAKVSKLPNVPLHREINTLIKFIVEHLA